MSLSESKGIEVNRSEPKRIHVSPSESEGIEVNPSESPPPNLSIPLASDFQFDANVELPAVHDREEHRRLHLHNHEDDAGPKGVVFVRPSWGRGEVKETAEYLIAQAAEVGLGGLRGN